MLKSVYSKEKNGKIECTLCNHRCILAEEQIGICKVRKVIDGKLYSLVYEKAAATNIDPIEKKPLYHFLPSSYTFSFSTVGCNFKCKNCQNYEISQPDNIFGKKLSSYEIVKITKENHLKSISYTYTEPTVYYEYARDTGVLAKQNGIKNVFVSNGYMTIETIKDSVDWLDAINIDLKSFSEDFYKTICKGSLKFVLQSIEKYKELGVWVEVTTLLIPGYNDSEKEIREIAKFIKSIDPNIPWHISAFYPTYRLLDAGPTPPEKVINARLIGISEGLNFVYTGNIRDISGSSTYCPSCGEIIIERIGYNISLINLIENRCAKCGFEIKGVF